MSFLLVLPFLPILIILSSCMSSLVLFGDKIPFVQDHLMEFYGMSSSSICVSLVFCIMSMVGSFFLAKTAIGAVGSVGHSAVGVVGSVGEAFVTSA